MRLILRYEVSDGCTYSCTEVHPVNYDSAEALLVDFMEAAKAALLGNGEFTFLTSLFSAHAFYVHAKRTCRGTPEPGYVKRGDQLYYENPPEVLTLDEFFADGLTESPAA